MLAPTARRFMFLNASAVSRQGIQVRLEVKSSRCATTCRKQWVVCAYGTITGMWSLPIEFTLKQRSHCLYGCLHGGSAWCFCTFEGCWKQKSLNRHPKAFLRVLFYKSSTQRSVYWSWFLVNTSRSLEWRRASSWAFELSRAQNCASGKAASTWTQRKQSQQLHVQRNCAPDHAPWIAIRRSHSPYFW